MNETMFKLPRNFYGRLITDEDVRIGEKEHLLLEAYVPGIQFISNSPRFDTTICYKRDKSEKMVVKGDQVTIYGQCQEELPLDIYHLISAIARKHYISKKLFPVHAACLGMDRLILLAGHTNSGKTTVSLNLIKKYGMKIFSGNKTVIDLSGENPLAVVGTKTITIDKKYATKYTEGFEYGERVAFKLNEQNYTKGGVLSNIVVVRLNDGVSDWRRLSESSALHTLYPYFLDAANADVAIGNNIFDGEMDLHLKEYLLRRLSKALEEISVYSATGSLSFISEKIGGL